MMLNKTNIVLVVVIAVVMWMLPSCNNNDMPDSAIVSNDRFTITGDSLIMGDTVIYSQDGFTIKSNMLDDNGKEIQVKLSHNDKHTTSVFTEQKLVDALATLSAQVINNHSNLQFASSNDMYDAIMLTLSYTHPTLSMQLLKEKVKNGRVVGEDTDFYPAHNDRLMWVPAAWQVYLATGDREWLRYAYGVALATLRRDKDINIDDRTNMVHGSSSDYTLLTQELPQWMDNNEVFATYTLNNNIETIGALRYMADMADELGVDGSECEQQATRCLQAVNANMWNESHGQYTAMLYGGGYSLHSPCCDNRAQALAVTWGLAHDDDRAITLIEKTPITHCGVNAFYPAHSHTTEPCLNEQGWGLLQGLWNLAAARVDNDNALRRGLAALWRAQLLYSTPLLSGGNTHMDIACAVSNVAMTHRLMAGMKFEAQGIEFEPIIPTCLPGDKKLMGFKYRGSTLDITIKGTGHAVDFVLLDGHRIDGTFINASQLKGRHHIVITMTGGVRGSQGVTIVNRRTTRPTEPEITWNGDSAFIFNYNPALAYKLVVDGGRHYTITDSTFALPQIDKYTELAVVAVGRRCFSYASHPFVLGGKQYYHIPIAPAASHNESITLDVTVRRAGTYMLNVTYLSPATTMDVRTVSANTHRMGIVVMGGLGTDREASQSNLVAVDLLAGKNTITITSHPASHITATPLSLNLFKK